MKRRRLRGGFNERGTGALFVGRRALVRFIKRRPPMKHQTILGVFPLRSPVIRIAVEHERYPSPGNKRWHGQYSVTMLLGRKSR